MLTLGRAVGAWHTLEFRNEVRLLVPLLVTGCKIWHLREAGRFYPKMAWLSTVESLPDAAQVGVLSTLPSGFQSTN